MNQPTDKPLHDTVRRMVHNYRPAYNPQDWQQLQRRLHRQRWRLRVVAGISSLLILFISSWLLWPKAVLKPVITAPSATLTMTDNRLSKTGAASKIIGKAGLIRPDCPRRRSKTRKPAPAPVKPDWPDEILPIAAQYQDGNVPVLKQETRWQPPTITFSDEETAIDRQMLTGDFGPDSTSYNTLTRNLRQWPDAVVVCDLTSSMYPYSTQLFTWFRQNARNPAIKGIVFFTDCDSLGQQTKPGGPAGRMFVTRHRDVAAVLPVMIEAARNTVHNTDDAENDVAALLTAERLFPEAKHLILLADNRSSVKDMAGLGGVKKPVHVVLCGPTDVPNLAFQPDYETIARQTNGSLHTIDDDLNPGSLSARTVMHIGTTYYRYRPRKRQFYPTRFSHRPIRLLGFVWL